MTVLVTGGAGFIGSAVCRYLVGELGQDVIHVDALTYAGNLDSLAEIDGAPGYRFVHADVRDARAMVDVFAREQPQAVIHLAAESHVDRSIDGPAAFIDTNVLGTSTLLEAARTYWAGLPADQRAAFRFLHVSTDEVYGALGPADPAFTETTPYRPTSPYAASKASADHLVAALHRTYGLPAIITNCSNNYGPYQFPEKLIPLMIINGLEGRPLPVYGSGQQVRDWLHVADHARALWTVLNHGAPGAVYNIGGAAERTNIAVVSDICDTLDALASRAGSHHDLITFVTDRPGHDARYAIDTRKIAAELGWQARKSFEDGLHETITWYMANRPWWQALRQRRYDGERLGLARTDGEAG